MDIDLWRVAAGFIAAVLTLALLVWVAGVDGVLAAMGMLGGRELLLLAGASLAWLAAWGLALRTVLGALGVPVGPWRAFLLYAAAAFSNNVTPFGQAGGEPLSALLISRATYTKYERGLAAIASVDALNFAPSVALALLGLGYYAAIFTVGRRLLVLLAAVVAVAVVAPTAAYALWRARATVERVVSGALAAVVGGVGRFVPRYSPPPASVIADRVAGFVRDVERVADSRRTVVTALAFSTAGWLCMAGALWVPLAALAPGAPLVALAAALVAVPAGAVGSATPLPGGLGGVEFTIVVVVVPITGLTADAATAAALLYRGGVYWLPTAIGGLAAAWLGAHS